MNLIPNFQEEGVDRISVFRGGFWEIEGVTFLRGFLPVLRKKQAKSEIFNDKKVCKQKWVFLT